jgi:DNA-binding transcriptional ArsR family regulator
MPFRIDDVFGAIADPGRREILGLLARRELAVKDIAAHFETTRPAVAKHLAVLERAALVRARRAGRERLYRLTPRPLCEVQEWVTPYARFWRNSLRRLKAQVEGK